MSATSSSSTTDRNSNKRSGSPVTEALLEDSKKQKLSLSDESERTKDSFGEYRTGKKLTAYSRSMAMLNPGSVAASASASSSSSSSSSSPAAPAALSSRHQTHSGGGAVFSALGALRDAISLQQSIKLAPLVLAPIGYCPNVEQDAHQSIDPYDESPQEAKEKTDKKQGEGSDSGNDDNENDSNSSSDDEEQPKSELKSEVAPSSSSSSSPSAAQVNPARLIRDIVEQFTPLGRTVHFDAKFVPSGEELASSSGPKLTSKNFTLKVTQEGCAYSGPIGKVGHKDVGRWHKHGVVSPFGDVRTQRTVVDTSVREAREISADNFSVSKEVIDRVEALWSKHFLPKKVRAQPYKINVYGAGVGFDWHRDTPETGLVGTFLLNLYNNSRSRLWLKSDPYSDLDIWSTYQSLEWCAFYPDVPHAVSPIEEDPPGLFHVTQYRCTLAFKIFRVNDPEHDAAELAALQDQVRTSLHQGVGKLPLPFGVHLRHEYSLGTAVLNGIDAVVLAALKSIPNTRVETLPVLLHYNHWYNPHSDAPPDEVHMSSSILPLSDTHLALLRTMPQNTQELYARIQSMANQPGTITVTDESPRLTKTVRLAPVDVPDWIRALGGRTPFYSLRSIQSSGDKPLHQAIDEGSEYTGNESREACEDSLYLQYAIVVLPTGPLTPAKDSDWSTKSRPHEIKSREEEREAEKQQASRCVIC